ncbi:MAG TPA: hypothetical protein ENN19_15605 [Chloroflexi bacterium]|nr:hypothetical protein [Chloroflexota bacterium]
MKLRARVILMGGILGAIVGAGAAYMYLQSTPIEVDEEGEEHLPPVQPSKAITAGLGVLTAIKQVTGLSGS